ncbi:MAG: MFS transporter, partial [Pseudomonadota bacterium]|nr:MFS transporter [Pseudomonadota bacterium]
TDDYVERSRIVGYRYFFGWWGGLTMAVLAYLVFLPEAKGGLLYTEGWRNYGLSASIIMFISILVSSLGTHRHIPHLRAPSVQPSDEGFSLRRTARELRETLGNPSFLVLFAAALFSAVAAGVSTTLSIYFVRHMWGFTTEQIGYLQFPYFFSAMVALWLGPKVTQALGKRPAAISITAIAVALAPALFILRMLGLLPDNGTSALFWIVLSHGAIEVALIITSSILVAAMIADVVEDSEIQTGRRSEGTFFAANTFAQKAVNGLGVLVAGQLLAWVEFPTGAALGTVSQETIFGLATYYIPVQWVLYGFAIVLMGLYRISRAGHEANINRLRARRSSAPGDQPEEHTGAST